MSYLQIILLALIQGLTEFFPVSSSGHLVLLQNFFSIENPPILFDVLVHVGTLFAVLVFFSREIKELLQGFFAGKREKKQYIFNLFIASLPICVVGFLIREDVEKIFSSPKLVGFSLLATAFILFLTKFSKIKPKSFNLKSSFFVGLFQALAIIPGISRSGSTISAGLFSGLKREKAFRFSFLLSIPAIIGALFLQLLSLKRVAELSLLGGLLGMTISFVVGFLSLKFLEKIVVGSRLWLFGVYCLLLGVFSLVFF